MRNKLLLLTALALTLTGCKLMEPKPGGSSDCAAPGEHAPEPPAEQVIPDTGVVPTLPVSTHIVVGMCPATGAYAAMGVDTQGQRFTFLISGGERTRQQAFQKFHEAGVPVTVYTRPVRVRTSSSTWVYIYDPCKSLESGMTRPSSGGGVIAQAVEDPPETPKPTGGQAANREAFAELAWKTAFALECVSDPATTGRSAF